MFKRILSHTTGIIICALFCMGCSRSSSSSLDDSDSVEPLDTDDTNADTPQTDSNAHPQDTSDTSIDSNTAATDSVFGSDTPTVADTGTDTDTSTDTAVEDTPTDTQSDTDLSHDSDFIYQGCRSPLDSGCTWCCDYQTENGSCLQYVQNQDDTDVYTLTNSPCPALCFPCARCLDVEEAALETLLDNAQQNNCDCATVDVGIDPCFAPTSCECICQQYDALAGDCGPEAEQICALDCPYDTWPEVDGTPGCACTADLEMTVDDTSLETSMVSMTAQSSLYIGGIDKLNFTFTWRFDDPRMADEEIEVICQLRFEPISWPIAVSPWNLMYEIAETSSPASPLVNCQYYAYPTATPVLMYANDGFVSLRQTGDNLEGHVALTAYDPANASAEELKLSGPFETPFPEF